MGFELIIGTGILIFVLAYMFFKFSETSGNEHFLFQVIILGLLASTFPILGTSTIKESVCETLPINSTNVNNTILYEYDRVCFEPSNTENAFLKLTQWFFRFFWVYVILYLIYRVLKHFEVYARIKKHFKK